MSTLKSINVQHPSSATINLVNDSSGNVTVGNNLTVTGTSTLTGKTTATTITSPAATALTIQSANTTAMTISTSQNVGIGTISPTTKFHVSGSPSTYITVSSSNASTGSGLITNNATNSYIIGAGANSGGTGLEFRDVTNSATRMVLDANGNLVVGPTAATGRITAAGGSGVGVYVTSTGNHGVYADTGATGAYGVYGNTSNASYGGTIGYHNGSGVFGILGYAGYGLYTNASISVNGTIYSSDARLKENVTPIGNALQKIAALNPVSFDWKKESSRGPSSDFGLIAQEVEQIIPECVFETKTPTRTPEMTHPLSLEEELGSYKGIDYSRFIPFLIAACQELSARNDVLEARLAALEAK